MASTGQIMTILNDVNLVKFTLSPSFTISNDTASSAYKSVENQTKDIV
jgi:hypothetical protein